MLETGMHAIQLQHYTKARFSCFSLDEEILVNAGHVAPRVLEPACEGWWVVLVKVCNFSLSFHEKCNKNYICTNNLRILP